MTKAEQLADAFQNLLNAAIKSAGDDVEKVCVISDGLHEILDKLDTVVNWETWLVELQTLLGKSVGSFDGWGMCFGFGLTPAEAIACRDHGAKREAVIDYYSTNDAKYNLVFG